MKTNFLFISFIVTVLFLTGQSSEAVIVPYITGTSAATYITEGPYEGWYRYDINILWGHNYGLSHLDIVLKPNCVLEDHLIEFDVPAAFSTSEDEPTNPTAMGWSGYFSRNGDPSLDITEPVLKYNSPFSPSNAQPGEMGFGVFSFYSNIIPESGTHTNALVFKADNMPAEYGDLEGAYPSCIVVPEPATLCLLGIGSIFLFIKRK